MTCTNCGADDCRDILCCGGCSRVLGCLQQPPKVTWSEATWASKMADHYCPSCYSKLPAPADFKAQFLALKTDKDRINFLAAKLGLV